jgi:tetratricopeptide (TPR) repeat protein
MINPDQARTLIEEGGRLRATGDRAACLNVFKEAARRDSANVTALVECGYEYLHFEQTSDARIAFEAGFTFEPDDKPALIGLGHTFRQLRQFEDAERAFRHVLELEPDRGGANVGLGYTLKLLDQQDQALEAFQTAAKANLTNSAAKIEAARLLRELGRADEAIALLREAVDREPSNTGHLSILARLLKQTEKYTEATEPSLRLPFFELGRRDEAYAVILGRAQPAALRRDCCSTTRTSGKQIRSLPSCFMVHLDGYFRAQL